MPDAKRGNCKSCPAHKGCRDTAASWFFLFIGLLATIAIRAVNLFLDFSPLWAKIFWYIGVVGFFIYFLYKFRQDRKIQNEIRKRLLAQKLSGNQDISAEDREFLRTILCKLKSNKDVINYFFIFSTSGLALILGVYLDFIR
jgi:hypothetical protein